MCQLSINNPIEAIYFARKRHIRFSCQFVLGAVNLIHELNANHMHDAVFVNQKSLICSKTDCKT